MTSEVKICNMSLISLGEKPITSLDEGTNRSLVCSAFYEHVRDAVLESFPWNFAKRRATLSRLSATPIYGYAYQYSLPRSPKCLRVLSVQGDDVKWRQEENKLLTDEESVKILYIAQITDPAQFSPTFVMLLAARLSAEIAYPITKTRSKEETQWKLYEMKEIEAFSNQSQEGSLDEVDESDDLIVRRG